MVFLPNLVSVIRMGSAPWIGMLIVSQQWQWAWMLFLGAALSDLVDGVIARRLRAVSALGRWLDPLADKVLILSILLILARIGSVPVWLVALILARDAVLAIAIVIRRSRRLPDLRVLILGKVYIALQYFLILSVLGSHAWNSPMLDALAGDVIVIAVGLLSVVSAIAYGVEALTPRARSR